MIPNYLISQIKWGEIQGQTLRKIRKDRGLTQSQLADKVGVSRQTVAEWEKGQLYRDLPFQRLEHVCHALSLSVNQFVILYKKNSKVT